MARRPNIIRPTPLTVWLPETVRARLDLHLWSAVEGRVPHGAYAKLLTRLINDYLDKQQNEPVN